MKTGVIYVINGNNIYNICNICIISLSNIRNNCSASTPVKVAVEGLSSGNICTTFIMSINSGMCG